METRVANRHILSSYDDELRRLERLILEMGGHCEELLAQALEALANRDADLAAEAIRHDIAIDALEREIGGLAVRLLALRQPMAVDLRQTLAALRMSSWLERVGDYAKNIGKRTLPLLDLPPLPPTGGVIELGRLVQRQLHDATQAVADLDVARAGAVWRGDSEIDAVHLRVTQSIIEHMRTDPDRAEACTHLVFIAKNLERIGDLSTNIAELLHFSVTGDRMLDPRPKGA